MSIQNNIAAVMRELKKQSGKSMTEFSEQLEISRSALQEYLAGTGNPSVTTVEHIAEKLNIDPVVLFSASFSTDQLDILLLLLNTVQSLDKLSPEQRTHFAELFLEMVSLWK